MGIDNAGRISIFLATAAEKRASLNHETKQGPVDPKETYSVRDYPKIWPIGRDLRNV
jgi:hypothetical protein